MSWLKKLLRVGSKARLMGVDLKGNQYYEHTLEGGRIKRHVRVSERQSPEEYSQDTIPPEWSRWLSGVSESPPSVEEQEMRLQQQQVMKHRVDNVNSKDSQLRSQEMAEGLVAGQHHTTKATDHASAPSYRTQSSQHPTSTGKEFIPGSWKP